MMRPFRPIRESSLEYAVRRAKETGKPYAVSFMGHALWYERSNASLMRRLLGGIHSISYPNGVTDFAQGDSL